MLTKTKTPAVTTAITAKATHKVVTVNGILAIMTINETRLGREVILTRVAKPSSTNHPPL